MTQFPLPPPAFKGNSRAVEAGNGFDWLRQGWALFIARPGAWIAMTVLLLVILVGLHAVPLLGMLAAHLLLPVLAAGMLLACRKVAEGVTPEVADLFVGFRQNTSNLIMLGLFYLAGTVLIAVLIGALLGAGGAVMGSPAGFGLAVGGVMLGALLPAVLSLPLAMALWFAPALVFFNGMPPTDAVKTSFHACLKNALPFLVYGLMFAVLAFFAVLPVGLGLLVLIPVTAGSVYAAYRDIFLAL